MLFATLSLLVCRLVFTATDCGAAARDAADRQREGAMLHATDASRNWSLVQRSTKDARHAPGKQMGRAASRQMRWLS
ncbi:MAG TPA: hypothetical protein VI032_20215 [Burkholderiaceae bacterium]